MPSNVKLAGYFSIGDMILFGKYKNKKGIITALSLDDKGNPIVEIEPVPKGRKQPVVMHLFNIWHAKPVEITTERVAARYRADPKPEYGASR